MILFIDCYDSFSYNLTHLISHSCDPDIVVVHNDQITSRQIKDLLPGLDAIVIGPGPGDPHNISDRGVIDEVLELVKTTPLPLFGVCFGYQSLVLNYGGKVERMHPPIHGRVSKINFTKSQLFNGVPQQFEVVRYHSLCCTASNQLICTARSEGDNVEMAAEHPSLPFFGVQFHPESVKSSFGETLFKNFWKVAVDFNKRNRNVVSRSIPKSIQVKYTPLGTTKFVEPDLEITKLDLNVNWTEMAEFLRPDFVLLKSASIPGKFTIFGLLEQNVTPHLKSKGSEVFEGKLNGDYKLQNTDNIWTHMSNFMSTKLISPETAFRINSEFGLPFLGGLVGYVTYEGACMHTVNHGVPLKGNTKSDVSFVFVSKSVIFNDKNEVFAVGPRGFAKEFIKKFKNQTPPKRNKIKVTHKTIDFLAYEKKFNECLRKLYSGDSYELCLTTQTSVSLDESIPQFELFKKLVETNPAPYCSYMDFDDVLLATSPERFMAWDHRMCEFRPIKGTVKRGGDMTLAKATEILKTDKEQAENLMIVDLIRHDIGHLLSNVTTPQLMVVEEYHSVYQLVTSVKGTFDSNSSIKGIDVLYQSLPPGSMTGAPKQRSCEILRQVENEPRGLYSGVHGYWSIDDRGDFSVIIRSLYKTNNNEWRLGSGGGVTVLSTVKGEYDEMNVKIQSVLNGLNEHLRTK